MSARFIVCRSPFDVLRNRRPSRRGRRRTACCASKPKRSLARVTSRRGAAGRSACWCPRRSGPRSAAASAIFAARSRIGDLDAAAQVDRLARVVALGRQHDALGGVLDVEELARRRAVAPQHDLARRRARARVDELADHRRDDVRRLQVEVVARAVEVHREQHDAVHAVLLAVGLRLHQQHLLGDAVGRVGLLGVAVPEVVFLERHRRELRIGADGAGRDELRDPASRHSSKSCRPIIAFSNRKRPGLSRLAPMPPTCAARWMTRSGRASASRRRTAARSTRS